MAPVQPSKGMNGDISQGLSAKHPVEFAESPAGGLQWVSVDHPGHRLDAKKMSTVRSHVMRRYRHEQGQIQKEKAKEKHRSNITVGLPKNHQTESLKPELTALAHALGLHLDDPQIPGHRNGTAQIGLEKGQVLKPRRSERLGYSPIPGEEYEPPVIYCLECGAPNCMLHTSGRIQKDKQMARLPHKTLQSNFKPSPQELLGAGRVDPFRSYPIDESKPYLHEAMDHGITYLFPGLVPEGMSSEHGSVSHAWFSSALKYPFLFHALVFGGLVHLDFLRTGKIYPNSALPLSHKLSVIQALKHIMQDPEKAASIDEVILSVSVLSSHEVLASPSESSWSPFNSPLKTLTWLDVYGNIAYVPEHSKAVMDLVALRGGLENIKLYGLAEVIAGGDVNGATCALTKPSFPIMKRAQLYIDKVRHWAKTAHNLSTAKLASGFQKYRDQAIMTNAIIVFEEMADLTTATDNFLQGRPRCLNLGAIAMARSSIQHRLMSLPDFEEVTGLDIEEDADEPLDLAFTTAVRYEACLAAAKIYSIAVTWPIPNARSVFQPLVTRLEQVLGNLVLENCGDADSDLLMWVLIIGGIAALDTPERPWFVRNLAHLVDVWKVENWDDVEKVVNKFLWLESTCGSGGKLLWDEVLRVRFLLIQDC